MQPLIHLCGRWRPGKRRALAAHRNPGLEMVLITGGQTRWQIGGRVEHVPPGSVFFTFPWEQHGGVDKVEPGLELFFVVLNLARRYDRPVRDLRFHPHMPIAPADRRWIVHTLQSSPRRAVPVNGELARLIRQLVREAKQNAPGSDALAGGLATAAVVHLARCVGAAQQPGDASRSDAVLRVTQLLSDLERRHAEPWSLERMAIACGLGRTRLAELIKQQTGDTPTMALNRVRVRQAQRALRETDRPVTQIALDCGFSSSQYFARVFRAYSGVSARRWRAGLPRE